jgi:hypothetical protein
MKNTRELLEQYKKENHPFYPVIQALLANSNSSEYLETNLKTLLIAISADVLEDNHVTATVIKAKG